MAHSISSGIRPARPKHALQRTGTEPFSLMSHWFYSMIGSAERHKFKQENENVV
jgi:hypothetical protein